MPFLPRETLAVLGLIIISVPLQYYIQSSVVQSPTASTSATANRAASPGWDVAAQLRKWRAWLDDLEEWLDEVLPESDDGFNPYADEEDPEDEDGGPVRIEMANAGGFLANKTADYFASSLKPRKRRPDKV